MTTQQAAIDLLGAGGHASVVADVAVRAGCGPLRVWFDGRQPDPARFPKMALFASVSDLPADAHVLLGMGDQASRQEWRRRFPNVAAALIDPSAILGHGVQVAAGVVAMPGVIINANASISEDAILNTGSIIEHDCRVGRNVHIASGVRFGGGVVVGDHAFLGAGAVVLPGIEIGAHAVVAAGAVVISPVPPGQTVMGVPARLSTG